MLDGAHPPCLILFLDRMGGMEGIEKEIESFPLNFSATWGPENVSGIVDQRVPEQCERHRFLLGLVDKERGYLRDIRAVLSEGHLEVGFAGNLEELDPDRVQPFPEAEPPARPLHGVRTVV